MRSRHLGCLSGRVVMSGVGGQGEEPSEEEHVTLDHLKDMERHLYIFRERWAALGELD